MLTIYGSPRSSAGRCFWCLEETGQEYTHKTINMREKEHKSEAFLKINPNGKIPVLLDDDFTIWESMGITSYLADKYKKELLGSCERERGLAYQWSFWGLAELQPPAIEAFIQLIFVPEDRRDASIIEKALAKLPGLVESLDNHLKDNEYVAGKSFTVGDINVLTVLNVCKEIKFDLTTYSNIKRWIDLLEKREAYQRYLELCKG